MSLEHFVIHTAGKLSKTTEIVQMTAKRQAWRLVQTCNPGTREAEAGRLKEQVSLGYIARP
jgi:hypothetical protein